MLRNTNNLFTEKLFNKIFFIQKNPSKYSSFINNYYKIS